MSACVFFSNLYSLKGEPHFGRCPVQPHSLTKHPVATGNKWHSIFGWLRVSPLQKFKKACWCDRQGTIGMTRGPGEKKHGFLYAGTPKPGCMPCHIPYLLSTGKKGHRGLGVWAKDAEAHGVLGIEVLNCRLSSLPSENGGERGGGASGLSP